MFRISLGTPFALIVLISVVSANTTRQDACKLNQNACHDDLDCCSGSCSKHPLVSGGGRCKRSTQETHNIIPKKFPAPKTCKPINKPCTGPIECCSLFCLIHPYVFHEGVCAIDKTTIGIKKCIIQEPVYLPTEAEVQGYPITAISKSLRIGTMVIVILSDGNTTVVLINANGPFGEDDTLNLSEAAARELNMVTLGEIPCRAYALAGNGCLENNETCRNDKDCCQEYCYKPDKSSYEGICKGLDY